MTGTNYQQKLEAQISQHREVENTHDLPDISSVPTSSAEFRL